MIEAIGLQNVMGWPTSHASRAVALRWLGEAGTAAEGLRSGGCAEDRRLFRLGLGRLRTSLKAYRPWLDGGSARKRRRKVREVWRSVDALHELEMARAWLGAQVIRSEAERAAHADILKRLDQERAATSDVERTLRRFGKQARRLRADLGIAPVRALDAVRPADLFGPATGGIVRGLHADLTASLERFRDAGDSRAIRRSLIDTERISALLEPFVAESPTCATANADLLRLQERLAGVRAAAVLGARIDEARAQASGERIGAGYVLLGWRAARALSEMEGTLRRDWLKPGRLEGLVAATEALEDGGEWELRVSGGLS